MAYNFRPNSVKEILSKRKTFSEEAGVVYTFIKDTYGATIVLDPTTQFKEIKIPRVVEETDNIKTVKQKISNVINLANIKISFGNGSGAGGSKIDATTTAMQENATRFVCEEFIEKGRMPAGSEIEKIYPKYDDEWANTFDMVAKALKGFLKSEKNYEYSRDEGIMPFVEKIARDKCGVKTKDSWNPADIYIVKKSKKIQIQAELTKIGNMSLT